MPKSLVVMSTLCAFFGIDNKRSHESGHASAYLISDSYLTNDLGETVRSDAQKVLASSTMPAIFGYVGDEQVGTTLAELIRRLDADPSLFAGSFGSEARANIIQAFLAERLPPTLRLHWDSTVVYIGRDYGANANQSQFHIWTLQRRKLGPWDKEPLGVPTTSGPPTGADPLAGFWGSGATELRPFTRGGGRFAQYSGFSWAYFLALAESLRQGRDKKSGGAVQIAFLPRGRNGEYVGIVTNDSKFVCGKLLSAESPVVSRWINEDFDELDPLNFEKRQDRKRTPKAV